MRTAGITGSWRRIEVAITSAGLERRKFIIRTGVIQFGLPQGIVLAVFLHGRVYGYQWGALVSESFLVYLLLNSLTSMFAGYFYGAVMWWFFSKSQRQP